MSNAVAYHNLQTKHNVLLLCREVTAIKSCVPKVKVKAVAFFDVRSQLSFMLKNLINRLKIEGKDKSFNTAGLGNQTPVNYRTVKPVKGIKLNSNEIIQVKVHTVNHLINDLEVTDLTESNRE